MEEYDDEYKVRKESSLTYHSMSSIVRHESINKIKTDLITMYDEYVDLGEITKEHS